MNGYISGPDVVAGYLKKINELFGRSEYLAAEQARFQREAPDCAFSEMAAYLIYKTEADLRTERLNQVYKGTSFDDCICQPHGMLLEQLPDGRQVKRVYLASEGRFYVQDARTHSLIQLNSLNLSWVPTAAFRIVDAHCARGAGGGSHAAPPEGALPDTLGSVLSRHRSIFATWRRLRPNR